MNDALILMAVGMITVFIILSFVVLFGHLLIRFVNRFFPEELKTTTETVAGIKTGGFSKKKLAAIVTAVDITTAGKGKITKIEK